MSKKSQNGFTLIELIVVIAIISLLSSIIFASTKTIKTEGRNTTRNRTVDEYVKAFSLYYDTYGEYPNPGDSSIYCLAKTPLECAWATTPRPSNLNINNAIAPYIKVEQPFPIIYGGPYGWQGLVYQCNISPPTGKCMSVTFTWFLEGNKICTNNIPGGYNPGWNLTTCQLALD